MDMNERYILDDQGNPVLEPDLIKWGKWFGTSYEQRKVGNTHFGPIHVSTVFLGQAHVSKELDNDDMMLYETMVFADNATLKRLSELAETDDRSIVMLFLNEIGKGLGNWGENWDIQKRYATKEEAIAGHKNMCTFIETCITKGLVEVTP